MSFQFSSCSMVLFLLMPFLVSAQPPEHSISSKTKCTVYGALYHQHHDFFGKAFSFQGLEAGVTVANRLSMGGYGALFASKLKTEVAGVANEVWMGQYGLVSSYIFLPGKRFHPGCQLNAGLFRLTTGHAMPVSGTTRLNGTVLSPQVFGEFSFRKHWSLRAGLALNFYGFHDHTEIRTSDLNHLSFNFGLVFHGTSGRRETVN